MISLHFTTEGIWVFTSSVLKRTFRLGSGFVLLRPAYAQTELESN